MSDGPDFRAADAPDGRVDEGRCGLRPRSARPLGPREQRRLLWRFMPAALALVLVLSFLERRWRGPEPPGTPQVDTALEAVRGPAPGAEAVIIEAPVAGAPPATAAAARSATAAALAAVRDDAFFREADLDAWTQTWRTLREAGPALAGLPAPQVSFAELFGQPRSFRGRLVRLRGTFRRIEHLTAPAGAGIDGYWQGWLEPDGGPASPVVVQFLELPEGMPTGLRVRETVDVLGFFLKRSAYQATDTVRVAPLVMALRPLWRQRAPAPSGGAPSVPLIATTVGAVLAVVVAAWLWSRPGTRRARPPIDVTASLAGFDPLTIEEGLRRLAAAHAADPVNVPAGNPAEPSP